MLRDVVRGVLEHLDEQAKVKVSSEDVGAWRTWLGHSGPRSPLAIALTDKAVCPACAVVQEWEDAAYEVLLEFLLLGDLTALYQKSAGLCVPHLVRAADRAPSAAHLRALVDAQRPITERLLQELDGLVRNSDYRFHDQLTDVDAGSWLRAIATIAGEQKSSFPEER